MKRLALSLAALLALSGAAPAQSPPARPSAPPASPEAQLPYDGQLLRLSELMGALAWLREICAPGQGAEFRAKMAALLGAEANSEPRKELFAGAFNRGFGDYRLSYASCTPAAELIITRFLDEAGKLAKDVADRFGG